LKTTCLYYLLSVVITWGIFFTLSMFFSFITIRYVVSYMVLFPILLTLMFYWQFKRVLERSENAHGNGFGMCNRGGVNMKNVVYVEWVPAGTLMKALVGFFSLLSLCMLLVTIVVGVAIQHPFLIVVLASPLAFVLFVFWNYRGIRIEVTPESLLVYYGLFNRTRILIGDIVSFEPTKASFGRYGGIGIRYGTDRSWAYTTSFGNAVQIILQTGKPFVFSSNNPEKICSIINQMRNVS
jgi:hypothetical protein